MNYLKWTETARRTVFENRLFKLLLSDQKALDQRTGTFTLMECPDWVNVIAYDDSVNNAPQLLMVRQYRFGSKLVSLEFPGGVIDPGEDDLTAAKRELLEETGYIAREWIKLGETNPNPAFMCNTVHTWLARGLTKETVQDLDENEILDFELVALADMQNGSHPDFAINGIMLVHWYWFRKWLDEQAYPTAQSCNPV